jgi:hypothetical protein
MDASSRYTPRPFLFPFLSSSSTMQKLSNYDAARGQHCGFGTNAKIPTGHEPATSTPWAVPTAAGAYIRSLSDLYHEREFCKFNLVVMGNKKCFTVICFP